MAVSLVARQFRYRAFSIPVCLINIVAGVRHVHERADIARCCRPEEFSAAPERLPTF